MYGTLIVNVPIISLGLKKKKKIFLSFVPSSGKDIVFAGGTSLKLLKGGLSRFLVLLNLKKSIMWKV